jgi:hypothetical protein
MDLFRPRRLRDDITAVVFSCDESELSRFSIESGPCVPLVEGGQSLVSPLTQDGGETPPLTAALFTALTGRSGSEALTLVSRVRKGRLSRCADSFVAAMASCSQESLQLADEDEGRGDEDLTSFTRHLDAVSKAWMEAGRWPRSVVGLQNRLVRLAIAREARAGGKPVFVWHGPPVSQFVVVSGHGPYPERQ